MRKYLTTLSTVSLILCVSILLSGAAAPDVYFINENKIKETMQSNGQDNLNELENFTNSTYSVFRFLNSVFSMRGTQLDAIGDVVDVEFPFLFVFLLEKPSFFGGVKQLLWIGDSVQILDYNNLFIRVKDLQTGEIGYVFELFLKNNNKGELRLSRSYDCVYVGCTNGGRVKAEYTGTGEIHWSVNPKGYVEVDNNGVLTGIKPGTVTLTASAGISRATCVVHCVLKWEKNWTGAADRQSTIYKGPGANYGVLATMPKGGKFVVRGDEGGSKGWAYGSCLTNGTEYWGFIDIKNLSKKGTVSQYNSLGWEYPLENKDYNHISSPYSPRANGDKHRGFDISESGISGQNLVAPFDGIVKFASSNLGYNYGCGNYICITSNDIDPITNKNLIVIYMHLNSNALFSTGMTIKKKDLIGYVGDTGNSTGPHLHFEANNRNAGIGDDGRSDFTNTINPIYFYMDFPFTFNNDCYAAQNGYGFYWYNYNQ